MTIKNLYKTIKDGMTFYSPEGNGESTKFRIIADEGRAVTDGSTVTECIDTYSPEDWTDCDSPSEATAEELLNIITGGAT